LGRWSWEQVCEAKVRCALEKQRHRILVRENGAGGSAAGQQSGWATAKREGSQECTTVARNGVFILQQGMQKCWSHTVAIASSF
jgi:hypothetical protein